MKFVHVFRALVNRRKPLNGVISDDLKNSWKDENLPMLQWKIVEHQLHQFSKGVLVPEFEALLKVLSTTDSLQLTSVLEVGCSSGYYSEIIKRNFPNTTYTGIDYSTAFIELGRQKFPGLDLRVADAEELPFDDHAFDLVVSGSVLLHIENWVAAIFESARVSKRYLVLHRTPVSSAKTKLFKKFAYKKSMIEWTFEESEILKILDQSGFNLVLDVFVYQNQQLENKASNPVQKSYIFERV